MSEPIALPEGFVPVDAAALPQLCEFLTERFHPGAEEHFASIDYLRWQYLEWPKGPGPRALNCASGNQILAHAGTVYTRFLLAGKPLADCPVTTTIHSWASTPNTGPLGAMFLFQSFDSSEIQYAFSFSPKAEVILNASGYALRQVIPTFRRVLKISSWNRVHAGIPAPKRMAFLAQEATLRVSQIFRPPLQPLELEQVTGFDEQAERIASAAAGHCLLTERQPQLLNHLLRHPFGETIGYYLRNGGKVVGLALLHFFQRNGLRQVRILDCLLAGEPDALLSARALTALGKEMKINKADVAFGVAGTPWLQSGFQRAGYVRRGRKPLLIRDPQSRLPVGIPVHMAFVDSDLAFV